LIFPEENRKDVDELESEIKEGMTFYFASHYFEVLELVLGLKAEPSMRPLPQLST
jgi:ATP-dependent Lon protease